MKPVVRKNKQQGFTLLELMVTLAIIGILATIGASQYQDYIARSRVAEGFNLAAPYKLAVAEQASANNGVFTVAQLGLPAFTPTQDVQKIEVSPMETRGVGGVITITYGSRVGEGGTLTLTPTIGTGAIQWQCAAAEVKQAAAPQGAINNTAFAPGTLPAKYAPANCRGS
ncbi:MAG: Pilin-like competence factor ComP [Herbaspirillum frisingense]|uniref:Pilin-like competence factor ComP n=1 Tax=Herbaspirillum frisingense TaxID=92645 RepID=A0A7V8FTL1_9BURK|nr:MAG: Pilin-like competence factor ComP [Herbaspirillum frisingense]